MLDVGRYTILGTIANSSAIQSSWFFYLTLLDQTAPRLNVPIVRVTVGQDFSFPLQRADHILDLREGESYTLSITNDGGTGITYDPTEGALTATTNTLSVGTYTVAGTISDGDSNESTWSLDLLVENPSFLLSRITVGKYQTCSNHSNGGVKCWGQGEEGRLGTGTIEDSVFPIDVVTNDTGSAPSLTGAIHLTTESVSACLLTSSGGVKCWGSDNYGQLGNGSTTDHKSYPTDVIESEGSPDALSGIVQVSVSRNGASACALTSVGGVKCWGTDQYGQLGNGVSLGFSDYPSDVVTSDAELNPPLLSGAIQVSTGASHACALTSAGEVKCWGKGIDGELGNGKIEVLEQGYATDVVTSDAVGATPFRGATQITSGYFHSCVRTSMGGVKCWGLGNYGQLGNGSTNSSSYPTDVLTSANQPLRNIKEVASGWYISCALTSQRQVMCWGHGGNGKLGDNDPNQLTKVHPVYVVSGDGDPTPLTGVSEISGGWRHACGLMDSGVMNCWGHGLAVHLGDGSSVDRNYPAPVLTAQDSDPLDVGSFRRVYTCETSAGTTSCSIDPIQLSFATGTSSPSSNASPEIIVSGISAGENVRLYSDETCKTQVGGQATSGRASTVSLSGIPVGVHRFYFRVFNSSDQAVRNCSENFIGYERR